MLLSSNGWPFGEELPKAKHLKTITSIYSKNGVYMIAIVIVFKCLAFGRRAPKGQIFEDNNWVYSSIQKMFLALRQSSFESRCIFLDSKDVRGVETKLF